METVKFDEKTKTIVEFPAILNKFVNVYFYEDDESMIKVNNILKIAISDPYTVFISKNDEMCAIKSEDILLFVIGGEENENITLFDND